MKRLFLAAIYRHWLWLGPPLIAAAAAVLWLSISRLVAHVRAAELFRVPLAESQEVEFPEAGAASLSIEGPRGTTRFASVTFELRAAGGAEVPGRSAVFRTRSSGFDSARTELLVYEIPRPGKFVLGMKGLGPPREGDAGHAVAFSRVRTAEMVAHIVGVALSGAALIAGLVFLILRLARPLAVAGA